MPELTYPHQAAVVFLEALHNQENFLMLKSTLIAKCLYQCNMITDVKGGEHAVQSIFVEYFPKHSFEKRNTKLSDNVVNHFLEASKGSSTIHVDSFIQDLWDL